METDKRGVSPVVATVLLISLAIALSLIVLFWARGFFSEQIEKNGKNIDFVCKETKIDVLYEPGSGEVKMKIKNLGSVPIGAVEIREEGNKEWKIRQLNVSVKPGEVSGEITYRINDVYNLKQLRVYPSLLGTVKGKKTNKFFACVSTSKTIKRSDLFLS